MFFLHPFSFNGPSFLCRALLLSFPLLNVFTPFYMYFAVELYMSESEVFQSPGNDEWSMEDCQKIQLPYAGNSLVPSDPDPFSQPKSLPR